MRPPTNPHSAIVQMKATTEHQVGNCSTRSETWVTDITTAKPT